MVPLAKWIRWQRRFNITVWLECAVLTYILVITPTFFFCLQINKIFICHPKYLIYFIPSSFALHGRFPPFYVFYPPTTHHAELIHQVHPAWASFPRGLIISRWIQGLSCSCIPGHELLLIQVGSAFWAVKFPGLALQCLHDICTTQYLAQESSRKGLPAAVEAFNHAECGLQGWRWASFGGSILPKLL